MASELIGKKSPITISVVIIIVGVAAYVVGSFSTVTAEISTIKTKNTEQDMRVSVIERDINRLSTNSAIICQALALKGCVGQ